MKECCGEINSFADEIRSEGYTYAVVLGMGGSSMCRKYAGKHSESKKVI